MDLRSNYKLTMLQTSSKPKPGADPETAPRPLASEASGRLRLLLLTNSITIGGMEEHVKLLARHLDRSKFEVFSINPHWEAIGPFNRAMAEIADHSLEITPDRRYGRWQQLKETLKLFRQLRAWHIEVLHMHSTTYRGQLWAFAAARLAGVSKIYVTEHLAPETALPRLQRYVRNLFSFMVNGIVCVSRKNYEARASRLYTPRARTTVVNNGVDLDDFPPIPAETLAELRQRYQFPPEAQIVGTAVRFEPEKGLEYLIEAMPKIREACPEAYFLMVGDGSLRAQLEAQVAELGMSEYVRFAGFQSNPRPFIGLMDAFVLPVPVGSMSIALLEAMAMERAVVITFGGEGEAVVPGESGLWAEPRNPASLAEAITRILKDPALKKAFGAAARQRIESEFSATRVAQVLGELYRCGR
jgi:glycosyltransferase involved in cell wall biosynthesis